MRDTAVDAAYNPLHDAEDCEPTHRSSLFARVVSRLGTHASKQAIAGSQVPPGGREPTSEEPCAGVSADGQNTDLPGNETLLDFVMQTERTAAHRFESLVERLPIIVYMLDADEPFKLTYISPHVQPTLGYTPSEVYAGQPDFIWSRIHPDDVAHVAAEAQRAHGHCGLFHAEYRVRASDGRWVWLRDDSALVRDEFGAPRHWQGVLLDITTEREADARKRQAEERYRELFDAAPVMYLITRNEAGQPVIDDCNETFLATLGYPRDQVIGRSLADFYEPRSRAQLLEGAYRTSLEQATPPVERQLMANGGRLIDALVIAQPERSLEGHAIGTRVSLIDISARKATEAALAANELRFQALVQNSHDIVSVIDAAGTLNYVSPSIYQLLGYAPEERLGGIALDIVHPDDQPKLRAAVAACVAGAKKIPPFELRVRHRDGSWHIMEAVGTNLLAEPSVAGVVFNSWDVSERKAAEAAQRESEARFQHAFDHAAIGMALIGLDDSFLQVNHALSAILGYAGDALLQTTLRAVTLAEDWEIGREERAELLTGTIADYQVEQRLKRETGELIWARLSVSLVRGATGAPLYFVVQVQDITPFKAAGAALRDSEQRFRRAFDHAPIGMALVDVDGAFLQVNRALCDIVGYSPDELQGITFQTITHADDLADDLELVGRSLAGEIDTYEIEKRYIHKDGHFVWIHLTASIVRDDGIPRYFISQILDITEQRQLELERATMLASEREYTRQLRALTEMRADLTAMIAHELRAPVSALGMQTYLLETGDLSALDQREIVPTMRAEIDRLNRLIDDVAAVTHAESEDFSVDLHRVPLTVLFEGGAAYARTALANHRFSMDVVLAEWVWCDPERIIQVLRNLLDNAGKHTPPGTAVRLSARRVGTRIRLDVSDYGPGLTSEEAALIFEKFGRGQRAAATQVAGAGLGLYLSRRILLAHGTDLAVESAPGQGTSVCFDLEIAT
ncbi:MAG: PAS domain S-box protein [Thermomicrobiales bacterium]